MDNGSNDNSFHNMYKLSIGDGLAALSLVLKQYSSKGVESERIARVVVLLIKAGADKQNPIFRQPVQCCLSSQKPDGGWIGVEDSIWSAALLKEYSENYEAYKLGLNWIKSQQLESGGWGKTERDFGRLPITGVLLYLLPQLSNNHALNWLEKEWANESLLNPKLTYKAAFLLMATKSVGKQFIDHELFSNTINWLVSEQNADYGWGPCKGHPIGSTPFCTGVALTGLLQYPDKIDRNVIANGLKWLEKNQLENGLWPDHYIEEGSAWCFYALTEGYKFLKGSQ